MVSSSPCSLLGWKGFQLFSQIISGKRQKLPTHTNKIILKYFCNRCISSLAAFAQNINIFDVENHKLWSAVHLQVIALINFGLNFSCSFMSKAKTHRRICHFFHFRPERIRHENTQFLGKIAMYAKNREKSNFVRS